MKALQAGALPCIFERVGCRAEPRIEVWGKDKIRIRMKQAETTQKFSGIAFTFLSERTDSPEKKKHVDGHGETCLAVAKINRILHGPHN